MPDKPRRVLLGAIAGAHGVKGLVKIKSFTAEPATIAAYGPLTDRQGQGRFALRLHGRVGQLLLAAIEGVASREAAERLRGTELYVARAVLPPPEEGSYYQADLIGLRVEDDKGQPLGEAAGFSDYGAGPILVLHTPAGEERLLPFAAPVLIEVDLAAGCIRVAPPQEIDAEEADEREP